MWLVPLALLNNTPIEMDDTFADINLKVTKTQLFKPKRNVTKLKLKKEKFYLNFLYMQILMNMTVCL